MFEKFTLWDIMNKMHPYSQESMEDIPRNDPCSSIPIYKVKDVENEDIKTRKASVQVFKCFKSI